MKNVKELLTNHLLFIEHRNVVEGFSDHAQARFGLQLIFKQCSKK